MTITITRPLWRALGTAMLLAWASASSAATGYFAQSGRLYDPNGQEIQLRGISHFGFNSGIIQPMYLWQMGWKEQIAQIKSLGFNAVRLPFGPDTLYVTTPVDKLSYVEPGKNADLLGKTPLQVLDMWMAEANRQGLYILLDFHGVSAQRQYPTWFLTNPGDFSLMYNKQAYSAADWTRDLAFVAQRYAQLPYFFAVDIYNEPNGVVRWSTGDTLAPNPANHWKPAAEAAAAAVLRANPNVLIFVQGITANYDGKEDSSIPINWGENFQPQAYQPLAIPSDKLVLSPHTYGPDVYVKSSFNAPNFPANLAADWEKLFGRFSQVHPVVIGEWGGRYGNGTGGQKDVVWQNALVDWLVSKNMRSSFYWSYTPNSGDTGGILDDNLNVRQDKLALLRRLWGVTASTPPVTAPVPVPATPVPAAPQPPKQPSVPVAISSFAPTGGSAGTVVTINGAGFSGATVAWVGSARNAKVRVISDQQVQVTVPAGASTGAIGVFTPTSVAFTPFAFTVGGPVAATPVPPAPVVPAPVVSGAYRQPTISAFTPTSGRPGSVVTIIGRGFNGLNQAWVGGAKNASIRVLSDTRVQVTVPAGARTGAIGILNPRHSAFTPLSFTVR